MGGGLAEQERQNLARSQDYLQAQSIPEMWAIVSQKFSNITALIDPHAKPMVQMTYQLLYQQMQQFGAGLQALGIQPTRDPIPPRVALFSDNCPRWPVADQGIMQAGAVDVVRSSQADTEELLYILRHSGAIGLIVEDLATYKKLRPGLEDSALAFIILLSEEALPEDPDFKVLTFSQVLNQGAIAALKPVQQTRDTLATLMYTSGTSGMPKGVMLTHGNLLHQVVAASGVAQPMPGERVMSILPIWHCYERTFEYFIFSRGCTQIYTNIRYVKQDLKDHHPHYMVGVPRLWESIYEGIQKQFRSQPADKQKLVNFFLTQSDRYIKAKRILQNLSLDNLTPSAGEKLTALLQIPVLWILHKLGDRLVYSKVRAGTGGKLKFVVSGGGSIADHLEDFFEIVGIDILGGYGLTETAPITHVRRPWRNIRGSDGEALVDTETKIVDLETRQPLPAGKQGVVLLRGPQIMKGYYNNPEATRKAIDPDGWFDSGDLGFLTATGDLVITGRAKDTIVLTNGENIEPQPIEDVCLCSPYIDQIMLVGQDQKVLGALIVPNLDALAAWAAEQGYADVDLNSKPIQDLFKTELTQRVRDRPGYRPDDQIRVFRLLDEPFTIDNGLLTQTLKIRRNVVSDRYAGIIDEMFS
ncbi:AMP-dependent synthetase/ligase [Alkalinema pantanalense CENA528]|uniref:AMP-dependent synthetase/ligase n=1 Tax=Alkalinema pantanalense TaxID=1620705 RepID=UPI003D700121